MPIGRVYPRLPAFANVVFLVGVTPERHVEIVSGAAAQDLHLSMPSETACMQVLCMPEVTTMFA